MEMTVVVAETVRKFLRDSLRVVEVALDIYAAYAFGVHWIAVYVPSSLTART